MDAARFVGKVAVFGIPGTGEMMGEVAWCADGIVSIRRPCMLEINAQSKLQMRDLIKGNKVIDGDYYYLNADAVTYAFYPSSEIVSTYKAMRAGLLPAALPAPQPQIVRTN